MKHCLRVLCLALGLLGWVACSESTTFKNLDTGDGISLDGAKDSGGGPGDADGDGRDLGLDSDAGTEVDADVTSDADADSTPDADVVTPDGDVTTPDMDATTPDADADTDADATPAGHRLVVAPSLGGGGLVDGSHQMRLTIGTPRPLGTSADGSHILRLGPQ